MFICHKKAFVDRLLFDKISYLKLFLYAFLYINLKEDIVNLRKIIYIAINCGGSEVGSVSEL